MRWSRIKAITKIREDGKPSLGRKGGTAGPGKKWGHSCNAVKNGRLVYIFGGYGKDDCQTNDVHVFDTVKETWSKPMVKGTPPTPRDSHTCVTVDTRLLIFGGTDGSNPLDDLHVLDTATNTWIQPTVHGDAPTAREGHSAALIRTNLYVFGGCGRSSEGSNEVYLNDLYVLDTTTFCWRKVGTTGVLPSPRDSHSCSSYKNKFIVLGGEDASNSYMADVHVLDVDSLSWKELKTTGTKLVPRAGHTTISHGKCLYVFGGFTEERKLFNDLHVLNLVTGVWTNAVPAGNGPSARFSLAGDCIDPEKGILAFYGGCNENLEALDDLFFLETETRTEQESVDMTPKKFSLRKELKRKRVEHRTPTTSEGVRLAETLEKSAPSSPSTGQEEICLNGVQPVAEKIFEASITDVFHYGYTLEAHIEGKPFRGLLFSYKPGFTHAVHSYLSRKRLAVDKTTGRIREGRKGKMKVGRAKQAIKRGEEAQSHPRIYLPYLQQTPLPAESYQHQIVFNPGQVAPRMPGGMYAIRTLPGASQG